MSISLGGLMQTISADAAMSQYYQADSGIEIWDIVVKMKTNTPGAGQLLTTIRYDDGEGPQDLNMALNLTAGNYAVLTWPDLFINRAVNIQAAFTFLAAGGTCDVWIQARNT